MPKVIFIEHDGTRHEVDTQSGVSLMEAAISNGVPGIDADCGGACACATCHVFVPDAWSQKTGSQNETEASMLDYAENVRENSRLACQIEITLDLDGIEVEMPEAQH